MMTNLKIPLYIIYQTIWFCVPYSYFLQRTYVNLNNITSQSLLYVFKSEYHILYQQYPNQPIKSICFNIKPALKTNVRHSIIKNPARSRNIRMFSRQLLSTTKTINIRGFFLLFITNDLYLCICEKMASHILTSSKFIKYTSSLHKS